jgi:DNA-directed RNA polymerase specialized sigma24 family protein
MPDLMTLDDKRCLLTARETLRGIRRVARSRGVRPQDWPDIEQQTCVKAWRARLPADMDGARRVVHRIAFAVACTHMGRHGGNGLSSYDESGDGAAVAQGDDPAYEAAVREQVRLLLEEARGRFPTRLDAFVASAVEGVSAREEAESRGVTEGHVRKERSEIRAFLARRGHKIGVVLAAALVLLVIGSMSDWMHRVQGTWPDDHGARTSGSHRAAPAADAPSLRARAVERFREGAYDACLEDLDAARVLDGREDSFEEAQMRADAMQALRVQDAEGPSRGLKPGERR